MRKVSNGGNIPDRHQAGATSAFGYSIGCGRLMAIAAMSAITGTTLGTGNAPARVSPWWSGPGGILRGVYIPQVIEPAAGTVRFNVSVWTEALSGADLLAGAMVDSGAWGVATLDQTGANAQGEPLSFQNDIAILPNTWYKLVAFIDVGASATAAQFRVQSVMRPDQDGSGYGRFPIHSTTNIAFPTGTPSALLSGLSWTDSSALGENIEYSCWWR